MYSASSVNRSAHGRQSPLAPDVSARRWYSANASSISALGHCPTLLPPPARRGHAHSMRRGRTPVNDPCPTDAA
jgi:hypothetical protein